MAVKVRSDVITLIRVNDGAKGDSYWMSGEWIDVSASTYDQDTYYPVVGTQIPRDGAHRIKTSVQLNSKTKPNWSTHAAGFSVDLEIQTQASGWGTTHAVTYIILDDFLFTNTKESPVSFQQKSHGSVPVLYLRGGGRYHVTTTYKCTWSIKTEKYNTYSGAISGAEYVEPTKTRPNTDGVPIKGINGDSVSSIVEEYYLSTSNTSQTGGSWATTPQSYVSGRYYWTRSHIVYKKADGSTYSGYTTPVLANGLNSANSEAKNATTIANGKNKVMFSATANPSGTSGYSAGDIWFNKSTGGIWQFNGSKWNLHQVGTPSIANGAITADKVAANAINAQKINVDTLSAISANLGDITAGDINGVTITGSEFRTNWTMVDAHRGIFSRVRFTEEELLFDVWWDESDDSNSNAPEDADNPIMVYRLYYQNQSAGDNIYGLILKESFYGSDEGNRYRVLMEPIDAGDGVQIHSGSGKVAFDSGDSATPTKILNKNNFGEPINSIAIGSEKEHTISFGWTGSRLRPVIDGNQIYMPVIDMIFYNPNNGMGSGVSLTSAATGYDALDIFCKTDDGVQLYTKVCNPAVGTTFEVSVNHMQAGGGHMWLKTKQFIIDGASHISTAQSGANSYKGILRIDSNSTPTAVSVGDYITIIKVVGWKY